MGQKPEKKRNRYIFTSPTSFITTTSSSSFPNFQSQSPINLFPPQSCPVSAWEHKATQPPLAQPEFFPLACTKNLHSRLPQNYLHFFTCATTTVILLFIVPNPNFNSQPQTNTGAFTSTLLPRTSTAMNAANLTLSSLGGCGGCGCC